MMTYLVYTIIYNCFMNEFPIKKDVYFSLDPIQLWYTTLWMHKAPFYIYQIHDSFLRRCREIFMGEVPTPITKESIDFLNGKGKLYIEDK